MHPKTSSASETMDEAKKHHRRDWRVWYAALGLFWLAFVGLLIYLTALGV
ncbi:MAG: hypothetical protein ACO39U_02800 [Bacteroidia bacterium]